MIDAYILYGPPGSGKGTISNLIPSEHCLGVGVLLRLKKKGLDGRLIPDSYVNQMVKAKIYNRNEYVVLDGYPRTQNQADYLMHLPGVRIASVFALSCPDEILMERLSLRQTCMCGATYHPTLKPAAVENHCDKCGKELFRRADDAPEIVQKRLEQFHAETNPLLEKFGSLVHVVDVQHDFANAARGVAREIIRTHDKLTMLQHPACLRSRAS